MPAVPMARSAGVTEPMAKLDITGMAILSIILPLSELRAFFTRISIVLFGLVLFLMVFTPSMMLFVNWTVFLTKLAPASARFLWRSARRARCCSVLSDFTLLETRLTRAPTSNLLPAAAAAAGFAGAVTLPSAMSFSFCPRLATSVKSRPVPLAFVPLAFAPKSLCAPFRKPSMSKPVTLGRARTGFLAAGRALGCWAGVAAASFASPPCFLPSVRERMKSWMGVCGLTGCSTAAAGTGAAC
mmetsp:Transcript_112948/g.364642  ORF Transcript_112948/g.364642 Transcript_112948/m.364642 type:complete len:242 (+) Transcript_112948:213-938(+)